MASLIRDKSGVFYLVQAEGKKRIWHSLRTRNRREAERLFRIDLKPKKQPTEGTLSGAIREYLEYTRATHSPKTHQIYVYCLGRFEAFVGNKPLSSLTPRDIEKFKIRRSETVAKVTVNQDLRGLRAFFNKAIEWGILEKTPCAGVKDIRIPQETRPYLSEDTLRTLLGHTSGTQLHDVILLAVCTGLRRGELVNLRWEDVDLDRKTIVVRSHGDFSTKSGRTRVIPMNSAVVDLLRGMNRRSGYVFVGKRGGKVCGNHLRGQFKRAVRVSGLDEKLHFHSLRHSFASLLVQRGISLYHVQKLLGHSSARMTEQYSHLVTESLHSTVDVISAPMRESSENVYDGSGS